MAECIYTSCITSFLNAEILRHYMRCWRTFWATQISMSAFVTPIKKSSTIISKRLLWNSLRDDDCGGRKIIKYYRNLFLKPVHEFKVSGTFLNIASRRSMLRQHKGEGNLPAIHEEAGLHFPRNFTVDLIRTWGVSCVGRIAITSRCRPALRNIPTSRALFLLSRHEYQRGNVL